MPRSHARQRLIRWGKGSEAFWSVDPDGTLIVFVHGWSSGALKAWTRFERLLPDHPKARGSDVVFYGYEGFLAHPQLSADLLYRFLETVATDASSVALSPVDRTGMKHRKIVLVAHSMGAIVCRRALLMAIGAGADWTTRVELVLFAPAQVGVRLLRLATEMQTFVGRVAAFLGGVRAISVATDALTEPSLFHDLAADTLAALEHRPKPDFLIAKKVVFGSQEAVVDVDKRFCQDPFSPSQDFIVIQGKGHVTVCKPDNGYTDPVEIVVSVLP